MKFCNVFSEIMHHGKLNSMVGSQRRLSAVVVFQERSLPWLNCLIMEASSMLVWHMGVSLLVVCFH